jgi:hypothetical protein
MCIFLKGIEDEEALTGGDSLIPLTLGDETLDETGQRLEEEQKQPFPLQDEPLFKLWGVGNGKPG